MKLRHALVLAAAAAACCPAAATAQSFIVALDVAGTSLVRQTEIPVKTEGGLSVTFQSDPATCEAFGRCGLDGTVTWRPAAEGELYALETKSHGRRGLEATLIVSDEPGEGPARPSTVSRVHRTGASGDGLCADGAAAAGYLSFPGTADAVTLGLRPKAAFASDLLSTDCAGPLLDDVAPALPTSRVGLAALRRGRMDVDLHGERPFTAAGVTGTARSELGLDLGKARGQSASTESRVAKGLKEHIRRVRSLTSEFRIERVSGRVGVDLLADGDPDMCGALDACGLAGTMALSPQASKGEAYLSAQAPASSGRRILRAALGLAPGGARTGLGSYGIARWDDHGAVTTTIGRAGDTPCTDREQLGEAAVVLAPKGRRVEVRYAPDLGVSVGGGLRGRCAGPALSGPLASASVPLRAFARSRVTLRLRSARPLAAGGYSARMAPDLTIVLRRERVRERITRQPFFGPG